MTAEAIPAEFDRWITSIRSSDIGTRIIDAGNDVPGRMVLTSYWYRVFDIQVLGENTYRARLAKAEDDLGAMIRNQMVRQQVIDEHEILGTELTWSVKSISRAETAEAESFDDVRWAVATPRRNARVDRAPRHAWIVEPSPFIQGQGLGVAAQGERLVIEAIKAIHGFTLRSAPRATDR